MKLKNLLFSWIKNGKRRKCFSNYIKIIHKIQHLIFLPASFIQNYVVFSASTAKKEIKKLMSIVLC